MVAVLNTGSRKHEIANPDGPRWYDPTIGRWLSEDPSGLSPDSDPYRYVGNGPTNAVDPTGDVLYVIEVVAPSDVGQLSKDEKFTGEEQKATFVERPFPAYDRWLNRLITVTSAMTDAQFDKLKGAGMVVFNKQKFIGGREEFIRLAKRELGSKTIYQIGGGYNDTLGEFKKLVPLLTESYDQISLVAHGLHDANDLPLLEQEFGADQIPNDQVMKDVIAAAGTTVGKIQIVGCFRNKDVLGETFNPQMGQTGVTGGIFANSQTKAETIDVTKVRKLVLNPMVGVRFIQTKAGSATAIKAPADQQFLTLPGK